MMSEQFSHAPHEDDRICGALCHVAFGMGYLKVFRPVRAATGHRDNVIDVKAFTYGLPADRAFTVLHLKDIGYVLRCISTFCARLSGFSCSVQSVHLNPLLFSAIFAIAGASSARCRSMRFVKNWVAQYFLKGLLAALPALRSQHGGIRSFPSMRLFQLLGFSILCEPIRGHVFEPSLVSPLSLEMDFFFVMFIVVPEVAISRVYLFWCEVFDPDPLRFAFLVKKCLEFFGRHFCASQSVGRWRLHACGCCLGGTRDFLSYPLGWNANSGYGFISHGRFLRQWLVGRDRLQPLSRPTILPLVYMPSQAVGDA